MPGTPAPSDDNHNANAGAHIGEGLKVNYRCELGMGMEGEGTRKSASHHHLRSSGVPRGGMRGLKGSSPNMDSIASRLVRYA